MSPLLLDCFISSKGRATSGSVIKGVRGMRVDHTGAPNAVTGFHKISRSGFGFGIRTETQFQIRTIEDSSAFNQMEQEWNSLLESSAADNLFLSWDWMNLWWRHLGKDRQLHVVEIRSNGTLVALLPLCIVSERLEFLGTGSVGS